MPTGQGRTCSLHKDLSAHEAVSKAAGTQRGSISLGELSGGGPSLNPLAGDKQAENSKSWHTSCFFWTVLGLHCCARNLSGHGEWRLLFLAACRLLIVVVCLVAEWGL